jgi:hypothetical protein
VRFELTKNWFAISCIGPLCHRYMFGVPYEYRPRATTFTELGASITLMTPYGPPGEIRTPYPLVRSQVLYPNELRAD